MSAARGRRQAFRAFPHLWLGVVVLFLYVGVEVMAGDAIGIYGDGLVCPWTRRDCSRPTRWSPCWSANRGPVGHSEIHLAGALSRALGGVRRAVHDRRYLTSGYTSVGFIAALGFANAMMWPAIFPLAIKGLGRHTETGSALLIMAIAGGALLPYAFAVLKQPIDFQLAYALIAVPAICTFCTMGCVAIARVGGGQSREL